MKYRHEVKLQITYMDMRILRQRLSVVMKKDNHTIDGKYVIRSLYFDTANDKALREKTDGVNIREKFRLRYYNGDTSMIRLEKKKKVNGLCAKESAVISKQNVAALIKGEHEWMLHSDQSLVQELYSKIKVQGLRPRTIVDYTREPYVFAPGNVRVTMDYNIRTGLDSLDFLNMDCVTVPAGENRIVLEVKWDEYLPDIIRDAIYLNDCHIGAFSKYAASRIYG